MNFLKKKSTILTASFSLALFYATSVSAASINPLLKFNSITSMTSKTDITVNLTASGLSKEDQQNYEMVQPFVDNLRISTVSKFSRNTSNTINNQYTHLMMNIGGTPFDTSIWSKTDISGKTPVMKEIVRVPQMMKSFLPADAQNKEYAVMDMKNQANGQIDAKKLASAGNKLTNAIINNLASTKPGLLSIKDRGTSKFNAGDGLKTVHNYTLKLDDNSLKAIMRSSVNNLSSNKDVIAALKDYIIVSTAANPTDAKNISSEIDKEIPSFIKDFNTSMDSLKNTKIVGKKGILINYSVDSKGYIVNTNGVIDLVINASTVDQIDKSNSSNSNGVYNLTINFNSNMYNINKGTTVVFPYLDKKNSFDYFKVMDSMDVLQQPA